MDWDQACAYWDNGAISTTDLTRIAHDLFEGEALEDALFEIAACPAAQGLPVYAAPQAP